MLAAVVGLLLFGTLPSMAQTAGRPESDSASQVALWCGDAVSRVVRLGVGKSIVIDFPREIKDVLVAEPKIANAVVRTSRRAYIIAVDKGTTNIVFFDGDGNQMAGYDIEVDRPTPRRTLQDINDAIARLVPSSHVTVESVGDGIVLSGIVSSQLEAQQAYDIASHFALLTMPSTLAPTTAALMAVAPAAARVAALVATACPWAHRHRGCQRRGS